MKSKLLFGFAVVAAFASVLLSGCGTSSTPASTCINIDGNVDTGLHKVYLGVVYGIVPDIHDTLSAHVTGTAVTIHDNALQRDLTGTLDASDCNKVNLDSVIFGSGPTDSLIIESSTLGHISIYAVRAGGYGTITNGYVSTIINIKSGKTNLSLLPNLSNVTLKGNFKKLP